MEMAKIKPPKKKEEPPPIPKFVPLKPDPSLLNAPVRMPGQATATPVTKELDAPPRPAAATVTTAPTPAAPVAPTPVITAAPAPTITPSITSATPTTNNGNRLDQSGTRQASTDSSTSNTSSTATSTDNKSAPQAEEEDDDEYEYYEYDSDEEEEEEEPAPAPAPEPPKVGVSKRSCITDSILLKKIIRAYFGLLLKMTHGI